MMTEKEKAKGSKYRKRFKARFMAFLCGPNNARSRFPNQIRLRMEQRFASVAKVVAEIKRRNYRHLAHLLQNYESTFFIATVCRRIKGESPDTVLVTKHDCIGTTPDQIDYVEAVIRDEFSKIGVKPQLERD
jgi:hypothetical protein